MLQSIEADNDSNIKNSKIIYCLSKNAAKTKAEFDKYGLIQDVIEIFYDFFICSFEWK